MKKTFVLLMSIIIFCNLTFGQPFTLDGVVIDENNIPLIGATVILSPIQEGVVTDENGQYSIQNLQKNTYRMEVAFIGYNTYTDSITINKNSTYNVQMSVSKLNLQEVVISDNYAERLKKEEALNIEVVNDEYLKQNLGGSLTSSLERLPGVTAYNIGSGQSKPVIRGLGFNRVVVAENGVKHEGQQWGTDHGLEIDQYAVEDLVVIKGPASLMYGSDAIGGVIEMTNRSTPTDNTFGGTIDFTGKSNNNLLGTSVALYGRKDWFYADARATIIDYGDFKVPTDSVDIYSYKAALENNYLRNTAGYEHNLHGTLGILLKRFHNKLYFSSINSKNGFFANAHGLEPRNVNTELHDKSNRDILYPYQKVNHNKLINRMQYQWGQFKLDFDLGFQRNFRQEWSEYVSHGYMPPVYPDTLAFPADLERQFDKYVYSGNLKLYYNVNNQTNVTIGTNTELHNNQINGRGFIIPEYKQYNIGGFAVAKHKFTPTSNFQLGIRYDFGKINTQEYFDWFMSPLIESGDTTWQYLLRAENIDRRFSNFSWSVGYSYHPAHWSLKVNIGKSFRMPIAKELAANGVNYHQFSYDVGNPDLSPEESYQLDAGMEYHSDRFAIGTTPFLNYFSNYIYLNPSTEHDRFYGNGNQVFYYQESEVLRYGAELHAHYELIKTIQLGIIGEYVYSEQLSGEKKGFTLPFSPPPSVLLNFKYKRHRLNFLKQPYLSVDYRVTGAQNNIVPPENPTEGYQVVNIAFGSTLNIKKQDIELAFQIQNLFNTKYFNHTSYYRLINVPEPGRNFIVNISIPFSKRFTR